MGIRSSFQVQSKQLAEFRIGCMGANFRISSWGNPLQWNGGVNALAPRNASRQGTVGTLGM